MHVLTYQEKKKRLEVFLKKYDYDEKMKDFILNSLSTNCMCDVVSQAYSACDILEENDNMYLEFLANLEKYFTLDHNIIDVGGGVYPALATYIKEKQVKLKTGTITVFDQNLVVNKLNGIILKKEAFTEKTKIKSCDLIIGTYTCEATIPIIRNARKNHIPFSIALCGCTHFESQKLKSIPYLSYHQMQYLWNEYVMSEVNKGLPNDMEIKIDYFNNIKHPYPIITKTYKK